MGKSAYRELGDRLENEEHHPLGDDGFERTVEEVAKIEAALRSADLAHFTP